VPELSATQRFTEEALEAADDAAADEDDDDTSVDVAVFTHEQDKEESHFIKLRATGGFEPDGRRS
jgi:hypothetical protein